MMIISYLGRWEYPWFYFTLTADESLSPSNAYHNRGYALEPQCPHRGIAPPRGQHWTAADYEKGAPILSVLLLFRNQRLPILPGRFHPSTFGVCGLNYCVRHGNRWIPAAIATEFFCFQGISTLTTA